MVDIRRQCFIIARLADYCDYRRLDPARIPDPTLYLWNKLQELEEPLYHLKQDILDQAVRELFQRVEYVGAQENDLVEFRQLLDRMVSAGDFADASFHLNQEALSDVERCKWAQKCLGGLKVHRLLQEENKPTRERDVAWEKLVGDLYRRLGLDLLEKVLKHKPLTRRRLRFILRRCRLSAADYCGVFHVPLRADDTFTPFAVPRVEALVAANRRFLRAMGRG